MLNTEQESGCLLTETLYKGNHPRLSVQWLWPPLSLTRVMWVWKIGNWWFGCRLAVSLHPPICCWWQDMALWHVKKIVGWLSFLCPCSMGKCLWNLFTACGETGEREEKWKSKVPMGDTRTVSGAIHFPGWNRSALYRTDNSTTLLSWQPRWRWPRGINAQSVQPELQKSMRNQDSLQPLGHQILDAYPVSGKKYLLNSWIVE